MSEIWNHFKSKKEDIFCNNCDSTFKVPKDGSTGKLWNHLKSSHGVVYKLTSRGKNDKVIVKRKIDANQNIQTRDRTVTVNRR